MSKKEQRQLTVNVNGRPDYSQISKVQLEPLAKKLLENILKELKENKQED